MSQLKTVNVRYQGYCSKGIAYTSCMLLLPECMCSDTGRLVTWMRMSEFDKPFTFESDHVKYQKEGVCFYG